MPLEFTKNKPKEFISLTSRELIVKRAEHNRSMFDNHFLHK